MRPVNPDRPAQMATYGKRVVISGKHSLRYPRRHLPAASGGSFLLSAKIGYRNIVGRGRWTHDPLKGIAFASAYAPRKSSTRARRKAQPRKCLVKVKYTRFGHPVSCKRHNGASVRYIARANATQTFKPMYDNATDNRPLYTFDKHGFKHYLTKEQAETKLAGKDVFKIILSPEDSTGIDLGELAKRWMQTSFASTQGVGEIPKDYVCANHYNTDNPHVHIIVSMEKRYHDNVPGKKDQLRFSENYLKKKTAMNDASAILTDMLRPRSKREYLSLLSKKINSRSFNEFDKLIKSRSARVYGEKRGEILGYKFGSYEMARVHPAQRKSVGRRLDALTKVLPGLVTKDEDGTYKLDAQWHRALNSLPMLDKLGRTLDDTKWSHEVGERFKGKITGVDIDHDEDFDKVALTVEDDDGKTHLIFENIQPDIVADLVGREITVNRKSEDKGTFIENKKNLVREIRKEHEQQESHTSGHEGGRE